MGIRQLNGHWVVTLDLHNRRYCPTEPCRMVPAARAARGKRAEFRIFTRLNSRVKSRVKSLAKVRQKARKKARQKKRGSGWSPSFISFVSFVSFFSFVYSRLQHRIPRCVKPVSRQSLATGLVVGFLRSRKPGARKVNDPSGFAARQLHRRTPVSPVLHDRTRYVNPG